MIAGILLMLVIPLAMAGVVYIVLRWRLLAGLLSAATALLLALMVVTLPVDQPVRVWGDQQIVMGEAVTIFGRELAMDQSDRLAMAFLFVTAAAIFIVAWRYTAHSLLFPIGLGVLSFLCGALLIRPLIYAALLVEIAAVLSVSTLQSDGQPPTRGGLRYLTFIVLALPGLMVTHWLLERFALSPNETGLLGTAAVLLAISFALLLGAVPFHTWVPAVTSDGAPLASTFVLSVTNGAVWFVLLDFLETYPWLSDHPRFRPIVMGAGLVMVVLGGLIAAAQHRLGPLVGYAALADSGSALIALSMNSQLGLTLVLLSLLVRPFGLILMAAGLSGLRQHGGGDHLDELKGAGFKAPWSMMALIIGGLSMAGVPVSAGFAWRWALYRALVPAGSVGSALVLLLAGAGVVVGVVRAVGVLLTRPDTTQPGTAASWKAEGYLTAGVIAVAMAGCIVIGFYPQLIAPLASRLVEGYTFFAP